jgi:hypothetical protein
MLRDFTHNYNKIQRLRCCTSAVRPWTRGPKARATSTATSIGSNERNLSRAPPMNNSKARNLRVESSGAINRRMHSFKKKARPSGAGA